MSDLSKLPTCDAPGCPGHLGKFDSCVTEALYFRSLDGIYDDGSTGSTEAHGHYVLFILVESMIVPMEEGTPDGRAVTVPAGNYIVESTDSGAVYLLTYDTEAEARAAFESAENAYAEWMGDEDEG